MDGNSELYISGLFRAYFEYLAINYPQADRDEILKHAGIKKEELFNPSHYFSQDRMNALYAAMLEKTGNKFLGRDLGRFTLTSEDFGLMKTLMLSVIGTHTLYELAAKVWSRIARNCSYATIGNGGNTIEVTATPRPGCNENPFQCQVRIGILESLAKVSAKRYAHVEHDLCIHRGDPHCRYKVSWQQSERSQWKIVRALSAVFSLAVATMILFLMPSPAWGLPALGIVVASMAVSRWSYRREKKERGQNAAVQDEAVKDLLELSNTHYGNALLIHELGQATSGYVGISELLIRVMKVMHTHLEFDKGGICLIDLPSNSLEYVTGFGFSPDEEQALRDGVFPVGVDSRSILGRVLSDIKPFVFNELKEVSDLISEQDHALLSKMNVTSGILVPIHYGREIIGILAVAKSTGKRLSTDIDVNLLRGIASHIAVSIMNMRSYIKLQESEQNYRTIFESSPVATIIIESDSTISLANSGFVKLVGLERDEIEGKKSWTEFISGEHLETLREHFKNSLADPTLAPKNHAIVFTDRHGSARLINLNVDVIPGTKRIVASLMDVTKNKKAEAALRKSEERYRLLAENSFDVIWLTDLDMHLTYISPSVERLNGYTVEEALNLGLESFFTAKSLDRAIEEFSDEIRKEQENPFQGILLWRRIELEGIRKDGSTIWTEVTACLLRHIDGSPKGILGVTRDISERKQAEEEKRRLQDQLLHAQKMEAVGTLAGGIAHDFNNILMGVQGNISLMLMDLDDDHPHSTRLKSIEKYVERGSGLTRQLLGFARGGKYETRPTDLNDLILKNLDMFGRTHKEIVIHTSCRENLWPVEVDRGQIDQVLLNLFVNAWQAMPDGGDLIVETANATLDEHWVKPYGINADRYVKVSVRDTGTGIDEDCLSRIFDPFFTTKEKGTNSGLGLASAYGIVTNHGGVLTCSSIKDQGATFTLYLPAGDKSAEHESECPAGVLPGNETVLLVDDEDMILSVGSDILQRLGYRALTVKGGMEALSLYREMSDEIDLVILDMIMPGMGGRETFDGLKTINPSVRVLLSSGYDLHDQTQDLMKRSCLGFIQKPFTIPSLSAKIRDCLAAKD